MRFRFLVGEEDNAGDEDKNGAEDKEQCPGLVCVYFVVEDLKLREQNV
jgi:hypothetical protein